VGVALEGGVPKIVLELAYDAVPLRPSRAGVRARRDETMSFERPTVPEPLRPRRIDTDSLGSAGRSPSRFHWRTGVRRRFRPLRLALATARAARGDRAGDLRAARLKRASLGDQIGYSRAAHRPGSDRRRGGSDMGNKCEHIELSTGRSGQGCRVLFEDLGWKIEAMPAPGGGTYHMSETRTRRRHRRKMNPRSRPRGCRTSR